MSLEELLPVAHALAPRDKVRLIQFLAAELLGSTGSAPKPQPLLAPGEYPVWSPYESSAAAATLLEALRPPMPRAERFAFRTPSGSGPVGAAGEEALCPLVPLSLEPVGSGPAAECLVVEGLVDSGAAINVLPYEVGLRLGALWPEGAAAPLRLGGNLGSYEAYPLLVRARVGGFGPVRLGFAWTRAAGVPVVLGQVNFFLEFDVCLYRSRRYFEVGPRAA